MCFNLIFDHFYWFSQTFLWAGITRLLKGANKEDQSINGQTVWGWRCSGIPPWRKYKGYIERKSCSFTNFMGWMFKGACTRSSLCWCKSCSSSECCCYFYISFKICSLKFIWHFVNKCESPDMWLIEKCSFIEFMLSINQSIRFCACDFILMYFMNHKFNSIGGREFRRSKKNSWSRCRCDYCPRTWSRRACTWSGMNSFRFHSLIVFPFSVKLKNVIAATSRILITMWFDFASVTCFMSEFIGNRLSWVLLWHLDFSSG